MSPRRWLPGGDAIDTLTWLSITAGLLVGYGAYQIGFTAWRWYLRFGVAFAFIGVALIGRMVYESWWIWAWGIALVLLFMAIPSGKKSQYEF